MTNVPPSGTRVGRPVAATGARRALLALALTLATLLGGPSCGPEPTPEPLAPVLLIGIDGLEWSVLGPLLADGRCPNLRALVERGSYGRLGTYIQALSPVVWTTIATGKIHAKHGITGFTDARGRPYTSSDRRVPALWNIASEQGLRANVFGWWISWPVEPIDGVMVSGSSSAALVAETWKPALLEEGEDQVHPPELTARVLALAAEEGARERLMRLASEKVFGVFGEGVLGDVEERLVQQTLWSIQSDATYARIAAEILAERPADLTMVYLGGPDVVGHRFWRQYRPDEFEWRRDPAADAALADVIPRYYEWVDELVGQLVAAAPDDATVLVVSDHGMAAINTGAPPPPSLPHMTGHHLDNNAGVIIAAGAGIARQGGVESFLADGRLPIHGGVNNVAQTVLALLGVPVGRDMDGRAITSILTGPALERAQLPPIASHDVGYEPPAARQLPEDMERNYVERFKDLGYIGLETDDEALRIVQPEDDGRGAGPDGAPSSGEAAGGPAPGAGDRRPGGDG